MQLHPLSAVWYQAIAVFRRILIELLRRRSNLICWSLFPVVVLLLNGFILQEGSAITTAEAFEQAAPLTLIGAALFFSCLGGTLATVVGEREQRTLKRLFVSPLSGTSYFFGIFAAHGCIGIGQSLIVYTVAALLGAQFQGSVLLGITLIVLSIVAYVGAGFLLGTQFARRTEDVNELIAAIGVPTLILGGAFVPADFFPEGLLALAQFNPIYHMNEALSAVSVAGADLAEIQTHLRVLVIFAGLMIVSGWLAYRRMLEVERRL